MADLTTLANVKQWLGITTNASDALLSRLIASSSNFIETWLNRTLATQDYDVYRDGHGGVNLSFANYPVTAVTSLTIDDVVIPLSTSTSAPGYLYSATRLSLRGYRFTRGIRNVHIVYTAGFATTPGEVEQVCIELVGLRFKNKDRIGVNSKTLANESVSYTQADLSDTMKETLINYKKVITV